MQNIDNKIEIMLIGDLMGQIIQTDSNIGIASIVNEIKTYKDSNPNTIFVSAGDLFQGTAESNLTYGQPIVECLKEAGMVATAIGNHEYEWGDSLFAKWERDGDFLFLAANIYDRTTKKMVPYAKPYLIIDLNGIKVALIGLATPETAYKTKPENVKNVEFKNPVEVLPQYVKEVRSKGANLIIALTHLGGYQDESGAISGEAVEIAGVEGLDGIITGHTCQEIAGKIGKVPIIMACCNGLCIGKLTYTFSSNSTKLISAEASLDRLYNRRDSLYEDEKCKTIIDKHLVQIQKTLSEIIGESKVDLDHHTKNTSVLGEFVCDVMRQECKTEIAFLNGGSLRPWPKGKLTVGNINSIVCFDNALITATLTGSQLKETIENGLYNPNVGYFGQLSGINVVYDLSKPFGKRAVETSLSDGSPIIDSELYSVVTTEFMFYGGDQYNAFAKATDFKETGISLVEVLTKYIRNQKVIAPVYKGYQVSVS